MPTIDGPAMFCPKCGKAEQTPETYCRQCGTFLPDLSKPAKREIPPEENIKINSVLSLMTVIASFTLAILLYVFLGFRPETPILIYVTAGLLLAMGGWHIQTFIRSRKLKKQWRRLNPEIETGSSEETESISTSKLLEQADFENSVPASVIDRTTRELTGRKVRSS